MKRIFTLLCLLMAVCNNLSAQMIDFHNQLDSSFIPQGNYLLIGRMDQKYLFLYSDEDQPTKLVICDANGQKLKERTYDFFNGQSTVAVNLIPGKDSWSLIVQSVVENMHYTETVKLNSDGDIIGELKKIDSARYDKLKSAAIYSMTSSRNGEYFLLYRVLSGFSKGKILLNYLLLDKTGNALGTKSFFVPFDEQFETLNNIFLAPNGNVYFALHDKAENYRMGSNLRLYKSEINSEQPTLTEIYLKENKPLELAFDSDPENKYIALGALYSNFYSKEIEGVFTAIFNTSTSNLDTVVYLPMEKDFKKDLKKGVSGIKVEELVNRMHLKYFRVNPDGSISVLTELLSERDYFNNKAGANSFGAQRQRSGGSQSNVNAMPSQAFDQMRYDIASTTLPMTRSGRVSSSQLSQSDLGASPSGNNNVFYQQRPANMGDWNKQMLRSQTEDVTSANWQSAYDSYFQQIYATSIKNNSLVQKTIVFSIDKDRKLLWKTWVPSLYIPETPFTNVTALPFNNNVTLINYELTQNQKIFLQQQTFSADGKPSPKALGTTKQPLLFHGGNMLRLSENEILTLYFDPVRYKLGLASIRW
jgi:hypothetical protein